jgi:putative transposase
MGQPDRHPVALHRTGQANPERHGRELHRQVLRDECLNEEVFASLAEARAVIERWRLDYNQVRPHSVHRGLTPHAAHLRSAGARLRNPDQLRRAPATIAAPEPL